ncbi:P-loop containing nucleoside triphosphate hydrolase protein [Armillaria novae-zelandiae]|uniref:P-loop containing nucleoside triphosphate hydrolase protein n=1 Tax=Armillaria novae-zelandiae TaxID=153914 RepID=A0AA39THA3_9AGAR|nr:P-loop containing nucleoside triphosphate hydrolase protein [Armillaria novae-zelandiae]
MRIQMGIWDASGKAGPASWAKGPIDWKSAPDDIKMLIHSVKRKFEPSVEQIAIVNHLKTHNVVVSASPGAGKTATAEAVAQANPNALIAVVTYSKRLQLDTQRRFQSYPLVDVFTFHGLASRLFGTIIHNDTIFTDVRRSARPPVWIDVPRYEIVILDEMQDLTDNLYWLTCAFITFLTQLLVLGDSRQAIYEFRGADQRYLEQSPNILSTPYIQGSHEGPKPLYIHGNLSHIGKILEYIYPLIRGYGPENTAILAPSLRSNIVFKRIINVLWKKYKIPSAHAGSERDLVIVLGDDATYFEQAPHLPKNRCPNATFVALTRARKQLVVLHSRKETHMPFVNWAAIKSGVDFVTIEDKPLQAQYKPEQRLRSKFNLPPTIHVSNAARHVREEDLDSIIHDHLDIRKVQSPLPSSHWINAPGKVLTDVVKNQWEPVSDVNGLTVTLDFEYWLTGKVAIFMNGTHMEHIPADKTLKDDTFRAVWLSKEAIRHDANTSGFKSRWRQMAYQRHRFDWMVPHLTVSTQRLIEQFSEYSRPELAKDLTMEVPLQQHLSIGDQTTTLAGCADMIHSRSKGQDVAIWEVKFVAALSHEHVIQVIIYGYLWAMANQMQPFPRLVLYNVKNNEKWEIETTLVCAKRVIEEVLQIKHTTNKQRSLDEFLNDCADVQKEVAQLLGEDVRFFPKAERSKMVKGSATTIC